MKEQAIDSALILRKSFEHGEALSEIEISELLKESKLVEKLTCMDRRTNYYPRTRSFMIGVNMNF